MKNDYVEVKFFNSPELNDVLVAFLAEADFDMFEERNDGVSGYVKKENFNEETIHSIIRGLNTENRIRFEASVIQDKNWNEEWEKNFEPVEVAGRVYIRAPFHPKKEGIEFELLIEPKMSFGTGHHATTALMIEHMLQLPFAGKQVLDMGCGSGVLAILAEMLGAKAVLAIDIDEWAYENSIENAERNNVHHLTVLKGDVKDIAGKKFNIVLANINRNILLADMDAYFSAMEEESDLLMSGILIEDLAVISGKAASLGLTLVKSIHRDQWMAVHYKN